MPTTPSGILSLPLQYLKDTLAVTTGWANFCSGHGGAVADRIYLVGLPMPADEKEYDGGASIELNTIRPFAMINPVREGGYRSMWSAASAGGWQYHDTGLLELHIEREAPALPETAGPSGMEWPEADIDFMNKVGAIISDLQSLSGGGGYLAIDSIALLSGPHRSKEEIWSGQGDSQWCVLQVAYGGIVGGGG